MKDTEKYLLICLLTIFMTLHRNVHSSHLPILTMLLHLFPFDLHKLVILFTNYSTCETYALEILTIIPKSFFNSVDHFFCWLDTFTIVSFIYFVSAAFSLGLYLWMFVKKTILKDLLWFICLIILNWELDKMTSVIKVNFSFLWILSFPSLLTENAVIVTLYIVAQVLLVLPGSSGPVALGSK